MSLIYPWANSVVTILVQSYGLLNVQNVRLLKIVFMLIFITFGRRRMKDFHGKIIFLFCISLFKLIFLKNLVYAMCIIQK